MPHILQILYLHKFHDSVQSNRFLSSLFLVLLFFVVGIACNVSFIISVALCAVFSLSVVYYNPCES
jgi:hypothetical protein